MPDVFEAPQRPGVAGKRKRRSSGTKKPYWIDQNGVTLWEEDPEDFRPVKAAHNPTIRNTEQSEPATSADLLNHITPPEERRTVADKRSHEQQIAFLEEQLQQLNEQIERLIKNQTPNTPNLGVEANNPTEELGTLRARVNQQQAEMKTMQESYEQEKESILKQANQELVALKEKHAQELLEQEEEKKIAVQQVEERVRSELIGDADVNLEKVYADTLADLKRTRERLVKLERERESELRSAVELEEMIVKKDREIFMLKRTNNEAAGKDLEQLKGEHAEELRQKDEDHRREVEELERVGEDRAEMIDVLNADLEGKVEDIAGLNDKLETMGRSLVEKHGLWQKREIGNKNLKKELTKAFKKIENRNAKIEKLEKKLREARKVSRTPRDSSSLPILARLSDLDRSSKVEDLEEATPIHSRRRPPPPGQADLKAAEARLYFDSQASTPAESTPSGNAASRPGPSQETPQAPKVPSRRRMRLIIASPDDDSDDESN